MVVVMASAPTADAQPVRPDYPRAEVWIETADGARLHFDVEVATEPMQLAFGLMFVESMPVDQGMLFIMPETRPLSFWMRNTFIPLDMIFIAEDGTILNIAERTTPLSDQSYASAGPGRGVLEINGGVSAMLGIRAGDVVLHEAFGTAPDPAADPSR